MKRKRPRKIPIITKRIILNVFIAGTLLCGTLFAVGVWSFTNEFTNQYDTSIRAISAAACECLPTEKLSYYADTKQKDDEYNSCQKILQDFVDKFELTLFMFLLSSRLITLISLMFLIRLIKTAGLANIRLATRKII